MKKKLTYALCALLFLAGFFGLCAVSESKSLPLWEGLGVILGILLLEIPVVRIVNNAVKDTK